MKDIVIIGAGPVGLYAWNCANMMGLNGYIIEGNNKIGGQPIELYAEKEVYDVPSILEIKASDLVNNLYLQATSNNTTVELLLETEILEINEIDDHFSLKLSNKETIECKTLLITTGNGVFNPIKLEHLNNEIKYENLDYQVLDINKYQNKNVIILGGGDSAIDWANHLVEKNLTNNVSIVHRREHYRAIASNVIKLQENNVKEYKPYEVKDVITENNKILSLILKNNNEELIELSADYFIVQYGVKISKSIINNLPIEYDQTGKIKINANASTSHPLIFAAGNIATYKGKYYNMLTGWAEAINALYSISKILYGERYHPGYLEKNKV